MDKGTIGTSIESFEKAAAAEGAGAYIAVFKEILKENDETKLIELAQYEDLNIFPEIAKKLAKHENLTVRKTLADNQQLRHLPETTAFLSADPDIEVLQTLAANGPALTNSPKSTEALAQRKITSVSTILAANGLALAKSELATLLLARSKEIAVRLELANNLTALLKWPSAVLVLAQDPDETIRNKITPELLEKSILKIATHGTTKQKTDLANNPLVVRCPPAIFALFKDKEEKVHSALSKQYIEIGLSYIATHGAPEEKIAIAEYWNLRNYPKVTEILSRDELEPVRLAISDNSGALIQSTAATLNLLQDHSEVIRERVAGYETIIRGLAKSNQESVLLTLVKSSSFNQRYPELTENFSEPTMFQSVRLAVAGDAKHLIFIIHARGEKILDNLRQDPDQEVMSTLIRSLSSERWRNAFDKNNRLKLLAAEIATQRARDSFTKPSSSPEPI